MTARQVLLTLVLHSACYVLALSSPVHASSSTALPSSPPTLYIAANFRDNAATVPGFVREIVRLAADYSAFVTVYESGSTDETPSLLQAARSRFDAVGVDHAITIHGKLTRNDRSRIDFLADARNELLKPLRSMAPGRVFDYVVFLNDVHFVAEDVVKLLSVGGDVSCGTDFIPIGDANQIYRPSVNDTYPIFYDAWVARSMHGLPLRAMPPYVPPKSIVPTLTKVATMGLSFPDYTRIANMLELEVTPQPEIVQLQCCWNGVVVVRAAPFYRGLSFRSNLPGGCAASECSHFCVDMWALNYTRFTMHHGVRVAYEAETWQRAKALSLPYTRVPVPFAFAETHPSATLCCGEHRIVRLPSYERQPGESTHAFVYRVWTALHEAPPPNDDAIEFLASFVGDAPAVKPDALRFLLSDEPRAACEMQKSASLVPKLCLADRGRSIPIKLTQAGTAHTREALIPYVATWKTLHPDHEYAFVDVSHVHWDGVPSDIVSLVHRALDAGRVTLADDIARDALLYYSGGIVADVGSSVVDSLSCVLDADDELVSVFAQQQHSDARRRRPIAVAATRRHPAVRRRLQRALERAASALGIGDEYRAVVDAEHAVGTDDFEQLDGARRLRSGNALAKPRRLIVAATLTDGPALVSGDGPRLRHRLDATVAA